MRGHTVVVDRVRTMIQTGTPTALLGPVGSGKAEIVRAALGSAGHKRITGIDLLDSRSLVPFCRALDNTLAGLGAEEIAAQVEAWAGHDVVVIDDAQWLDPSSWEVVGHLTGRVTFVVTGWCTGGVRRRLEELDITPVEITPPPAGLGTAPPARKVPQAPSVDTPPAVGTGPGLRPLTPRETEILHLVAEGLTSAAIADRLELSRSTVEGSIADACERLGARTRAEAVVRLLASEQSSAQAPPSA